MEGERALIIYFNSNTCLPSSVHFDILTKYCTDLMLIIVLTIGMVVKSFPSVKSKWCDKEKRKALWTSEAANKEQHGFTTLWCYSIYSETSPHTSYCSKNSPSTWYPSDWKAGNGKFKTTIVFWGPGWGKYDQEWHYNYVGVMERRDKLHVALS